MNALFIVLVSCFMLFGSLAHGQGTKQDTVFLSSSIKKTRTLYEQWIGGQSRLYNGVDAKGYDSDIEEVAYYFPDWEDGSVYYEDELYENVPMMYD